MATSIMNDFGHHIDRAGFIGSISTELACQRGTPWIKINADNAATATLQQLNCQLPYQPQTNDSYNITELGSSSPHPLQRDRPERDRRRIAQPASFGDQDDKIRGNQHDLGMTSTRTGNPVAWPDMSDPLADLHDNAGAAISGA
jgi:hypothetical protein